MGEVVVRATTEETVEGDGLEKEWMKNEVVNQGGPS